MRKIKNVLALGIGLLFSIILLEIFLRIWNPFPVRVKNDKLVLPANRHFNIQNTHIPTLEKNISFTYNSLGFRGPEMPGNLADYLSIITVGGSTTECRFLSDKKDWAYLLGEKLKNNIPQKSWVNNAGMDGHSTFGHTILLEEYLQNMHPDFIIYLTGINELERKDLDFCDYTIAKSHASSLTDWLKKQSEVAVLINNLRRSLAAYKIETWHGNLNIHERKHLTVDSVEVVQELNRHADFVNAFEKRLSNLVAETQKNNIRPILMTQPLMFGEGIDPVSKVNLETIESAYQNGKTYWQVLEQYNDKTRQIAQENNLILIDLAKELPKNSTYFYDAMHYTNEGSEKISEIIFEDLKGEDLW